MKATTGKQRNGNDPRRRDVTAMLAAGVHSDADPTGSVMGRSSRRVRQWKSDGAGSPQDQFDRWFDQLSKDRRFRIISHLKALAKAEAVESLSDADLIARFHELRAAEKTREGEDTCLDLRRGVSWVDRARMKERDACLDEEVAAVCREFASRGITEAEVFG